MTLSLRQAGVKGASIVAIAPMIAAMVGIWQQVLAGEPEPADRPGVDFAVFHSTALFVAEGNGSGLYDPEILGQRIAEATGNTDITSQGYRHPPIFSLFFLPLALLPFG